MTLTKKTTQVVEAVSNLLDQFDDKANLIALLTTYISQIQALEDALFELFTETSITTAVGAQLDGIGDIVGEDRKGRNDVDYRIGITARILVNNSSGLVEEVLTLAELLSPTTLPVLTELFPAAFKLELQGELSALVATQIATSILDIRGAGIGSSVIYWLNPEDEMFEFAEGSTPEVDVDKAWGNTAQTTGGHFAGVVGT